MPSFLHHKTRNCGTSIQNISTHGSLVTATRDGVDGRQGQVMLQRNNVAPKQSQHTSDLQELMTNLKELEHYQMRAQDQLHIAETQRNERREHQECLKKELEDYKYCNGELRVQIARARESNSSCLRMLQGQRLHKDRASEDIRSFDEALKKALAAVRINKEYKRKIEMQLIAVVAKSEELSSLKKEALSRPKMLETKRDQMMKKLEQLRHDFQIESGKAKEHSERVVMARKEVSVLEQDLAAAEQTEATTKSHAQSICSELEAVENRHKEEIGSANKKIEDCTRTRLDNKELKTEMETSIDQVKQQIQSLKKRLAQAQQPRPQIDACTDAVEEENEKSTDVSLNDIDLNLKEEEAAHLQAREQQETLANSIESILLTEANLDYEYNAVCTKLAKILQLCHSTKQTESERRTGLLELREAKNDTNSLKQAFAKIQRSKADNKAQTDKTAQSLEDVMKKEKQDIENLKLQVATKASSLVAIREALAAATKEHKNRLTNLKSGCRSSETRRNVVQQKLAAMEAEQTCNHPDEKLRLKQIAAIKQANERISAILHDHAELQPLREFTFDPDLSTEKQKVVALKSLDSGCKAAVESCGDKIDDMLKAERFKKLQLLEKERLLKGEADRLERKEQERLARLEVERERKLREEKEKADREALETEHRREEARQAKRTKDEARRKKEQEEVAKAQRKKKEAAREAQRKKEQEEATKAFQRVEEMKRKRMEQEIGAGKSNSRRKELADQKAEKTKEVAEKKHGMASRSTTTSSSSFAEEAAEKNSNRGWDDDDVSSDDDLLAKPGLSRCYTPKHTPSALKSDTPMTATSTGSKKRVHFAQDSDPEYLTDPEPSYAPRNVAKPTGRNDLASGEDKKRLSTGGGRERNHDYEPKASRGGSRSNSGRKRSFGDSGGGVLGEGGRSQKATSKDAVLPKKSSGEDVIGGALASTGKKSRPSEVKKRKKRSSSTAQPSIQGDGKKSDMEGEENVSSKPKKRHRLSYNNSSVQITPNATKGGSLKKAKSRRSSTSKSESGTASSASKRKVASFASKLPASYSKGSRAIKSKTLVENANKPARKKKRDIMGVSAGKSFSDFDFNF